MPVTFLKESQKANKEEQESKLVVPDISTCCKFVNLSDPPIVNPEPDKLGVLNFNCNQFGAEETNA